MFDIETILADYGLTAERYEELLKDCSDKVHKVSDLDWAEINAKYGIEFNSDTSRKGSQPPLFGGVFVKEYFQWKKDNEKNQNNQDSYLKELQIQRDELYKAKRQVMDQRREYNKLLASDSRAEHLMECMIECANKMNEKHPLICCAEPSLKTCQDKEAILFFSDWHYGMTTDNIWNKYNTDICIKRVEKLVEKAKEYLKLNHIGKLHIVTLGDAAHGSIHVGCRVASEEDTCDQIMHVAEIMAQAVEDLSTVVDSVKFYSCYGNHLRTIQKKNDSIHSDNMEKMIPWWMKQRLSNNYKVEIIESEFKEFTKLNVLGFNICCVHGDLDNIKNIGVTVNTLFNRLYGETIDYTVSGDKHHLEEFEQFDIESVIIRSLCGTDEYASNKRLYSKAGQTLMIFNSEDGRESTYNIPLK